MDPTTITDRIVPFMISAKLRRRALTVINVLFVPLFIVAGAVKLVPIEFERANFAHFGYAPWFMVALGLVEIAGGVMLGARALRLPGALLLAAIMVGAATSHLRAGDGLGMATPALVLLALLLVVAAGNRQGFRRVRPSRLAGQRA